MAAYGEIYASFKDPATYHCWKPAEKFRYLAEKAGIAVGTQESAERCFAYYLLGKGLDLDGWEDNAELAEHIIGSEKSVEINPNSAKYKPGTKVLFDFGQMFFNKKKDLIGIIDKENELSGVKVDGEFIGRGFKIKIYNKHLKVQENDIREYLNPFFDIMIKYPNAINIWTIEFGPCK